MQYFEIQNDSLIFRENGETVMVSPWGPDSLRVRSTILGDIEDSSAALLQPAFSQSDISVEDMKAVITNGKIRAELVVQPWGNNLQITFYNQKITILYYNLNNISILIYFTIKYNTNF